MKIKLRDMTFEQYNNWKDKVCAQENLYCEDCVFSNVNCDCLRTGWVHHKDLYSDKFLDQEIEVED